MSLKIISGNSNAMLAADIARNAGVGLTKLHLQSFPSGESYCQIQENVRGDDVFIVNGITKPANDNLMDTCIIADAARRASAGRLTAVIPYFGYARQDRKDKSRVPISAKLVMDILQASGIQRVVTMDLHSPQIAGFTNLPFDHLAFEPILSKHLYHYMYYNNTSKYVFVAPDVGAVKRNEYYAKKMRRPLALIVKNRLNESEVEIESFVGDVKDKVAIIVDDLTESCGTFIQAAQACKARGAIKVICAVTHLCATAEGQKRLAESIGIIDEFIYSDTVDYPWAVSRARGFTELSVAELFGKAISNIHENKSVSELFQ